MEERQVEQWKDMEYMEENCEKIGKLQEKPKLNSEKRGKNMNER